MSNQLQTSVPSSDSSLLTDKPNLGDALIASLRDELQSRAKLYLIRATGDSEEAVEKAARRIASTVIAEASEASFSGWNQLIRAAVERVVRESVSQRSAAGILSDVVPKSRPEAMRPAIAIRSISAAGMIPVPALSRFALWRPKVSSVNSRG